MNKISYSQISLFNECPQHWKLRYVDKISKTESNIRNNEAMKWVDEEEEKND